KFAPLRIRRKSKPHGSVRRPGVRQRRRGNVPVLDVLNLEVAKRSRFEQVAARDQGSRLSGARKTLRQAGPSVHLLKSCLNKRFHVEVAPLPKLERVSILSIDDNRRSLQPVESLSKAIPRIARPIRERCG